ncbi:serine hydrolase domain-containing protein [Luteimonas sp. e5]
MRRRRWARVLCGIGLLPLAALAAEAMARPPWQAQVDALLAPYAGERPGVNVAIVENGKLRYRRSVGLASLEPREPLDARSNFRLASVSKQFTAMATLLLVADGKLRLDESLTEVLPEFPAYGRDITIEQMLRHRSGLPDYEGLIEPERTQQVLDAEVLEYLQLTDVPLFAPGSQWRYSNSAYVLLALIVERRSGMAYGEFLQQRIFRPLGMRHTRTYAADAHIAHRAWGHSPAPDGNGYVRDDKSVTSATLGDGGVYSSLDDLMKWQRALFAGRLLPAPLHEAMFSADAPGAVGARYGLGWFIDDLDGGGVRWWHSGTTRGFRNFVVRYPQSGLVVTVLSNSSDTDAATLAGEIVRAVRPSLAVVPAEAIPP